jgi:pimeloyl-[acyl-carrier protein] methyl ester esterase
MRLLMLPGMDGTGRLFEPLLAALPTSLPATAIAYPPGEPLGYEGLLPLVMAAAAQAGGPFVVVGESFSGPLALMLAARRPPGLRGVVLCASFVRFPLPLPERWRHVVRPWMFRVQPLWLLSWVLLGRQGFGPLGRLLRSAVRSVSPEALAARAVAVAGVDVTAELQACPVPVLYLRAASDMVIRPGCCELIRSLRPDTRVVVLPGPHLVLQASSAEAAVVLGMFCESVVAAELGAAVDGGHDSMIVTGI